MESDEKYIESRFGKKMPFTVPKGYFESLAQAIADKAVSSTLPTETRTVRMDVEPSKGSVWKMFRKYAAIAACVAVVVGGFAAYRLVLSAGSQAVVAKQQLDDHATAAPLQDVSYEEIDYTMLDNEDIYSLVASN